MDEELTQKAIKLKSLDTKHTQLTDENLSLQDRITTLQRQLQSKTRENGPPEILADYSDVVILSYLIYLARPITNNQTALSLTFPLRILQLPLSAIVGQTPEQLSWVQQPSKLKTYYGTVITSSNWKG